MDAKQESVILELSELVDIGFGITLPPGAYIARRDRNHLGPQYLVELTAEEVVSLGGPRATAKTGVYDVSKFVRQGKIKVF